MIEGTGAPISFSRTDVAVWLLAQSHVPSEGTLNTQNSMSMPSETTQNYQLALRWETDGSASSGMIGHGSIKIGLLHGASKAPSFRPSVQDEYIDVRVDRHGSHVGNPFAGAPVHRLCKAYDELLHSVLTTPLSVEEALHDYEGLRQDSSYGAALLTPFEDSLLKTISGTHQVPVHRQRVRPLALRAWLVYHACLLQRGHSLRLWCCCIDDADLASEWACHAQLLLGALLWVSVTLRAEPLLAQPCVDAELRGSQVLAYLLEVPLLTSLSCRAYSARAHFYPCSDWLEISVTGLATGLLPSWVDACSP